MAHWLFMEPYLRAIGHHLLYAITHVAFT